ncbi:hypothetical protein TURU_142678 [Turdus rufiventris]|nr:hypothetical protein TURU_142678 [Turdus rufiventris]
MDLEELPTPDLLLLPETDKDSTGPPNSSTPQDLEAHPGLAELLQSLGGFLGEDGLSLPLQQELCQTEASLARAKERWLHQELLWRLLEEMIRDPQNLDRSVLRSLEEELTRAQLRRGPPEISELVPPPKALSRCCSLLTQLCSLRNVQADLDLKQGRYLQAKGEALLLKSRALLTESHHAAEAQLTELTAKLEAYKALGPEFRDLALELGQIRQESARKRQALSQLYPTSSACNQAQ